MSVDAPTGHERAARRLRACIERGNAQVTMIDIPEFPDDVGSAMWETKSVEQSRWDAPGLTVVIRGPLPSGLEYMPGDLVVRFIKRARIDMQAWDQGDRSVTWHPKADFLGESPWFDIGPAER